MPNTPLNILAIIGSLQQQSVTRAVILHAADLLREEGCSVDVLDLRETPLKLYNPDDCDQQPEYQPLRERVIRADAFLIGSPDYHGSPSGAAKNFLDYFWHEFAGKLFATLVASHEKGLTVSDQLRTIIRQCYAWSLPYAISFSEGKDVQDGRIVSDTLKSRLAMVARDIRVYGKLLAEQRRADLTCTDDCFMAKHRA